MTSPRPEGTPTQAPRPRSRWLAAAGFVIVASLIAGVGWLLRPQPPASPVPSATPQQAVVGFLDALVAGDAERALLYALNRPSDTALLTAETLAASRQQGALAVVNVPAADGNGTVTVPAEVTIGQQRKTINFTLTRADVGWRLNQVTSTIDPGPLPAALAAKLNGQPLSGTGRLEVFPGAYLFSAGGREVELRGGRVVVGAVGEEVRAGLEPMLTKTGEGRANQLAKAALNRCLNQRSPAPKGCPNLVSVNRDQKVVSKTIRWNLVGDPWRDATYTLDVADPTQAKGAARLRLRFRCTVTERGEKYQVDQTNAVDVRYGVSVLDAKGQVGWERVA